MPIPSQAAGFTDIDRTHWTLRALPPALRELVIERAIATDSALSLSKLKVIVLMVMWRHQHSLDTLLLEELLAADEDEDGENRLYH